MKILRYFLHLLQFGLIYGMYLMDDLYHNHLGFMRNVSFYSHKIAASSFSDKLFLLPLLLLIVAFLIVRKKKNLESLLLLLIGIFFLIWQTVITLETTPIYYLLSGIILIGFLLQMMIALLKGSSANGLLEKDN